MAASAKLLPVLPVLGGEELAERLQVSIRKCSEAAACVDPICVCVWQHKMCRLQLCFNFICCVFLDVDMRASVMTCQCRFDDIWLRCNGCNLEA